jgi:hypothetical protein
MQNASSLSAHSNDETDTYEDVDKLFSKLEMINPPPDMVARIMGAVAKLPSPQQLQKLQKQGALTDLDGMTVWYDDKEPS